MQSFHLSLYILERGIYFAYKLLVRLALRRRHELGNIVYLLPLVFEVCQKRRNIFRLRVYALRTFQVFVQFGVLLSFRKLGELMFELRLVKRLAASVEFGLKRLYALFLFVEYQHNLLSITVTAQKVNN